MMDAGIPSRRCHVLGLNRHILRLSMVLFTFAGIMLLTHSAMRLSFAAMRRTNYPANGNLIPFYLPLVLRSGPSTVCGDITTDTTWTKYGSPYRVTCDVSIASGVTLTITAGVTVQFTHIEDDVIISGTLQTAGTESAPITFQPLSGPTPGSWGRIAFMAGSSGKLDHTILEYGGSSEGLLYIASSPVQIMDSVVQYSANTGIYIQAASPLISSTQILTNTASTNGGGLYNDFGSPIIKDNTFRNNSVFCYVCTPGGGGLFNGIGNPTIQNNIFINNSVSGVYSYGGGLYNGSGSPIIQNNIFSSNSAVGNCYTSECGYGVGGGLFFNTGSPIILSNIIVNNQSDVSMGGISSYAAIPLTLDYNDVWNNSGRNYSGVAPGAHDISTDPLLVDPAHGDFHLAAGSPCIDAGDPANYPETDFEGDPRPMGPAPDIGADEQRALMVSKNSIPAETLPGAQVTYTIMLANLETFTLTNVLLTDTLPVETAITGYQSDGLTCTHDDSTWGGRLACTLDNASLAPGQSRALTVTVALTETFLKPQFVTNLVTVTATAGGEIYTAYDRARTWVSWCAVQLNDTPMGSDLQNAIAASTQPSDVVKVSGYCPVRDLVLYKTLILQGGWDRDIIEWDPAIYPTTLDGRGLGRVIEVAGIVNPTIEGFVITGGKADDGGGIYISSGSPTIQKNIFSGNKASDGGGLFNDSGSPTIQGNTFSNNSVFCRDPCLARGGGLYNETGNPTIQNNTITSNWAKDFGGGLFNGSGTPLIQNNAFTNNQASNGGGLHNDSGSSIIQNNTFSGNQAFTGGGLENNSGSPIIQNNTVFSNSSGGVYNDTGSPIIRSNIVVSNTYGLGWFGGIFSYAPIVPDYNDVWNNTGWESPDVSHDAHNISVDPLLVGPANGNFHLSPSSPCIDAGDPVNYPATDFEADSRPYGNAPDIGVDEFTGTVVYIRRIYLPLIIK